MSVMKSAAFALAVATVLAWRSPARADSGHVKLLTYNVAGLPDGFSTPHPSRNMRPISRLLAAYDLALIQEDYAYGASLRAGLKFANQSPPFVRGDKWNFGDGLSQFAKLPFWDLQREAWRACHGIVDSYLDCWTPKGFTVSTQRLSKGVAVQVYNVHLDAGLAPADGRAREAQIEQLMSAIAARSRGAPLILAGDTNIPPSQRELLIRFEQRTGLVDVCAALRCSDPERIDRVLFRSSAALHFAAKKWQIDPRFVDARGRPLSDHLAVSVELDWTTLKAE